MTYTRRELRQMATIEQAWDGDELKIQEPELRVWLVLPQNIPWNGDFVVERLDEGGCWVQENHWEN